MVKQCRKQGLPEPDFKSIRGLEFRTILARDIFTESVLEKLGLNERQLKAIKYVKKKGKITNKEYQELSLDISRITATRDLKNLVERNILKMVGKGKRDLHYILMTQK